MVGAGGLEMEVDGAGLIERPDLAEIGDGRGVGGIKLAVAGRDLEPVANLELSLIHI